MLRWWHLRRYGIAHAAYQGLDDRQTPQILARSADIAAPGQLEASEGHDGADLDAGVQSGRSASCKTRPTFPKMNWQ